MEVLELTDSSAIAKIQFDDEQSQVGVAYTYKPDHFYVFGCEDLDYVRLHIRTVESVGKFIAQMRKEGTLQKI